MSSISACDHPQYIQLYSACERHNWKEDCPKRRFVKDNNIAQTIVTTCGLLTVKAMCLQSEAKQMTSQGM